MRCFDMQKIKIEVEVSDYQDLDYLENLTNNK